MNKFVLAGAAASLCLGLAACGGGDGNDEDDDRAFEGQVVALTAAGRLVSFDRASPDRLIDSEDIDGLERGETLLGIDFRPADGKLYAVSSAGRIYTLDADGDADRVSTLKPAAGDAFSALDGERFGVDFNPVADRLRVVSDTGQNLRINVDTGETLTDGALNGGGADSAVTASAYTNSFAGTTTTRLLNLDSGSAALVLQAPPNDGTLTGPVPLGTGAADAQAFDIDGRDNRGYAAFAAGTGSALYTVDLAATDAAATLVGTIAGGDAVLGLALVPPEEGPTVHLLTDDGQLARIDPSAPNEIEASTAVSGLASGERLLGIDFRPADGLLYGLTSTARIVRIDTDSGAATSVATLAADPTDATTPFAALEGERFSVDFNPVADRLRVISDAGQSLRINIETGATFTDGSINRAAPATVVAAAYGSNHAAATATTLYDLDAENDVLARQVPPNDGTLVDVGALGLDIGADAALDIAGGDDGLVLAALRTGRSGPFTLYTVSLATGAATRYGNADGDAALSLIGGTGGPAVIDLAIRY